MKEIYKMPAGAKYPEEFDFAAAIDAAAEIPDPDGIRWVLSLRDNPTQATPAEGIEGGRKNDHRTN